MIYVEEAVYNKFLQSLKNVVVRLNVGRYQSNNDAKLTEFLSEKRGLGYEVIFLFFFFNQSGVGHTQKTLHMNSVLKFIELTDTPSYAKNGKSLKKRFSYNFIKLIYQLILIYLKFV